MTDKHDNRFNIGISRKLMKRDQTAVIPEFDLSPLLENPSITVSSLPDVDTDELVPADIADLDAAILFLERITAATLVGNERFSLFARYGVGFDTLDVEACSTAGIAVAIAPDGVRRPVATCVIALMLALTLNLKRKDALTRDIPAGWAVKSNYNGFGLEGRTLGIVGLGNIGAEVARLAAPFDMNIVASDPHCSASQAQAVGAQLIPVDQLFQTADVISLNCPLGADTHHLVNSEKLAMMKSSAYLINTARGPVVDEAALIEALQNGQIAGAGLDVFEHEPPARDNPLLSMPDVILSPHALCFTDQCMSGLGAADVQACLAVMQGQLPAKLVDPEVANHSAFRSRLQAYSELFS